LQPADPKHCRSVVRSSIVKLSAPTTAYVGSGSAAARVSGSGVLDSVLVVVAGLPLSSVACTTTTPVVTTAAMTAAAAAMMIVLVRFRLSA
jgi:hypothetical protein